MERYEFRHKPRKCPACNSSIVATILYGMPAYSSQLQKEIEEGKTVLGGCTLTNDDPQWQCVDCGADIYQIPYYTGPGMPPLAP